jgi:hypothetical protein
MFNYNTLQLCKKSITVIIECCIIFLHIEQGTFWHHSMEKSSLDNVIIQLL